MVSFLEETPKEENETSHHKKFLRNTDMIMASYMGFL